MRWLWPIAGTFAAVAACVLALALERSDAVDLPAPMTIEQAQALPDDRLVAKLTQDIGARLVRTRRGDGAWTVLASPARELWLGSAYEAHLVRGGLLNFLVVRTDAAPGLADIRDGYRALGANAMAEALDDAIAIAGGDGGKVVAACRDFKERIHGPPSVHPPGTVDPFARVDAALQSAAAQDVAGLRIAFARAHLAGLVTPP